MGMMVRCAQSFGYMVYLTLPLTFTLPSCPKRNNSDCEAMKILGNAGFRASDYVPDYYNIACVHPFLGLLP